MVAHVRIDFSHILDNPGMVLASTNAAKGTASLANAAKGTTSMSNTAKKTTSKSSIVAWMSPMSMLDVAG